MLRKGDLDPVAREARHPYPGRTAGHGRPIARDGAERHDPGAAGEQSLGVEKARGELLILPRRAHGDDQRLAVEPDLERLLDDDQVLIQPFAAPAHRYGPQGGREGGIRSHAAIIVPGGRDTCEALPARAARGLY